MTTTAQPVGLQPVFHPSGTIRQDQLLNGVVSGYGTAIYSGTPIKRDVNGTLIPTTNTANDPTIGVFCGCEFSASGHRFVLPYWPAGQTYDADINSSMIAYFTSDPAIIYEGQANGGLNSNTVGAGINLNDNSQGSTFTGQSTQALNATTTGATAATFEILNLAPYPDNNWANIDPVYGAFTKVRVKISNYQGQVA